MVRSSENLIFVIETRPPSFNGDGSEYKGIGNLSANNLNANNIE
jgi:hypothetical protein